MKRSAPHGLASLTLFSVAVLALGACDSLPFFGDKKKKDKDESSEPAKAEVSATASASATASTTASATAAATAASPPVTGPATGAPTAAPTTPPATGGGSGMPECDQLVAQMRCMLGKLGQPTAPADQMAQGFAAAAQHEPSKATVLASCKQQLSAQQPNFARVGCGGAPAPSATTGASAPPAASTPAATTTPPSLPPLPTALPTALPTGLPTLPTAPAPSANRDAPLKGTYPLSGIKPIVDNCASPWVLLASAPKAVGRNYEWPWTRQAIFANKQFKPTVNIPAAPGEVAFSTFQDTKTGSFSLVARCKDGGTCNKLAAMYKVVVKASNPQVSCGAIPASLGREGPAALVPLDGKWLPSSREVPAQCARLAACTFWDDPSLTRDVGIECQKAPASFKLACVQKESCADVVACAK